MKNGVGYDDVMKYTNPYRDIISIIKLNPNYALKLESSCVCRKIQSFKQ